MKDGYITMKHTFDKLCRICGNFDAQLIPIFSGDGLEHNLPGKIKKHLFSVTINENDDLPQQVCYQCVSSLVIWSDLFELSIKMSRNFKNELKQLKPKKFTKSNEAEISVVPRNDASSDILIIKDNQIIIKYQPATDNFNKNKLGTDDLKKNRLSVDTFTDDSVAAKIFDEINDFDAFLNNSPSSSVSSETEIGSSVNVKDDHLTEEIEITDQIDSVENKNESNNSNDNSELQNSQPTSQIKDAILINDVLDQKSELVNGEKHISTQAENARSTDLNSNISTAPISKKRRYKRKDSERGKSCGSMCDICGKVFKVPETLRVHVKTVHTAERPHVCPLCGTAFKRKDHLDCHIRYTHGDEKYPKRPCARTAANPKEYRRRRLCIHCGKVLSSTHLLKEHINSFHSDQESYKCEKCNISFRRYSNLYHHTVIRNHKMPNFLKSCEFCGLDFRNESFYLRHKWKHPETVHCDVCQLDFENNELFKQHIQTQHEDEKLLQCDTCGKKFRTKASLKLHIRVHTGEKPYQCQYCAWRFHKKGQLVVHIYRHTGERPHTCSICGKSFKQRGDMRKHKVGHLKQQKKNSAS